MTIAQQLEQKGIEKGLELGEQKGRLDIAVKLPESGMYLKFVKKMTGCQKKSWLKFATE